MLEPRTLDPEALAAVAEAAGRVSAGLPGAVEAPLPPELAERVGGSGDAPVTLRTTRWRAEGFEQLCLAQLRDASGGLVGCIWSGLSVPGSVLPIIGLDLFSARGRLVVVAFDLSPTDEGFWAASCEGPQARLRAELAPHLVERKAPGFVQETFSALAVLGAARVGAEAAVAGPLVRAIEAVPALVGQAGTVDGERRGAAAARNLAWRRAKHDNRREREGFARLFGEAWAARYLEEALFPVPSAG